MSRLTKFARQSLRNPSVCTGGALLIVIVALALAAPLIYPDDPRNMVTIPTIWPLQDPAYLMGSDMLGRDLSAQLLYGARTSLLIAFTTTAFSLVLGVTIGVMSGYCGGLIDDALMRFTEIFLTMPGLLFAIALLIVIGPSSMTIALALGLTSWPQIARLVRAEAMRVRRQDYVSAAITLGKTPLNIIARHVLPNSLAPVMVAASALIAHVILSEAALSFLGLADPTQVSWGSMVGAGRSVLRTAWYMSALPGLAIFLTVMAFTLIGNGLNDIFNPRTDH